MTEQKQQEQQEQQDKIHQWNELFETLILGVIFGEIETKGIDVTPDRIQLDFSGRELSALPHAKDLLAFPTLPPSSFKEVYKNPVIADYINSLYPHVDIDFEKVVTHIGHELIIDQSTLDYHPWLNALAGGVNKLALNFVHIRVFIIIN
ncbi:hypothetical protein I6N95_01700 [Vagococcus sp. BWB3-3]|uniref:Uncharacterized protein n=1 Tax=Vagococcus allomyrinae TaxID=2794353 RepID=A0A940PBK9_9ENTE|nr:hypothetical protein [Vagococcus allomyrinae]MBP1039713.1 hypothetical protein [Vagococcus allomyrinae]